MRQLARQLVHQICYSRYPVSFYLWRIGPVLKRCKVRKYYDQDCLKIFWKFSEAYSTDDSDFWKTSSLGSKKVMSIKKLPISKVESFLKSNFDLKQICKIAFTDVRRCFDVSFAKCFRVIILHNTYECVLMTYWKDILSNLNIFQKLGARVCTRSSLEMQLLWHRQK